MIDFGASEDPAAIVEHVDHREGLWAVGKPAVGRGVQLPEFADAAALPAPDGSGRAVIGFGVGEVVFDGPAADLSPIDLEVALAEDFAGGKAVGSRGAAAEPFVQKPIYLGGPVGGMIAARTTRDPSRLLVMSAGLEIIAVDLVKTAARKAKSVGGGFDFELAGAEDGQYVTD